MPDARGHGFTETRDNVYSYKAMADDIGYIINKLKLKEVDLIGHSMGGHLAAVVAARYPEKIRRVILEDPAFILRKLSFLTKFMAKILMNLELRSLLAGTREDLLKKCKKQNPTWPEAACEYWVESKVQLKSKNFKKLREIILNPYDWKELIPQISCKLLLVISERGMISEKKAKAIIKLCKDGHFVKIMDAGHYIHHDQPNKYFKEIKEFLK